MKKLIFVGAVVLAAIASVSFYRSSNIPAIMSDNIEALTSRDPGATDYIYIYPYNSTSSDERPIIVYRKKGNNSQYYFIPGDPASDYEMVNWGIGCKYIYGSNTRDWNYCYPNCSR